MTALVILLVVFVLADAVALRKGLRSDVSRRPPRSREDWGSPSLPSGPYAAR